MGDWQAKWIEAMESARTAETWQERDSWTRYATETRLAAAAMGRSSKERARKPKRAQRDHEIDLTVRPT